MVINEKNKFISIHVFRTGGSSIDRALGRMDRHDTHQKLETIPNWENYFSFGFVRNPWDRTVSAYMFETRMRQFKGTFAEYVNRFTTGRLKTAKKFAQHDMVRNCSYVGRFEHLQTDFNEICDIVGIKRIKVPHIWKINHDHYSKWYTDELKQIMFDASSGDIDQYGFIFDSTATTNVGRIK